MMKSAHFFVLRLSSNQSMLETGLVFSLDNETNSSKKLSLRPTISKLHSVVLSYTYPNNPLLSVASIAHSILRSPKGQVQVRNFSKLLLSSSQPTIELFLSIFFKNRFFQTYISQRSLYIHQQHVELKSTMENGCESRNAVLVVFECRSR